MIPAPIGIEKCARSIDADAAERGWDGDPSLFTLYAAQTTAGGFTGGVISAMRWPIPGEVLAVDPIGIAAVIAEEMTREEVRDSAPISFATRSAGPSFAGIGLVVEAWVHPPGAPKIETRNTFIVDCGGGFTALTHFRDGPTELFTDETFNGVMDEDEPVRDVLRDLVLGVLRHCPEGTGDLARVSRLGTPA